MKRYLNAALLAVALVTSSACFADIVNIGPNQLEAEERGRGQYTVVFESGFGSGLEAWNRIAPTVGTFSHVITYSRAGLGASPRRERALTLKESVAELEAVLEAYGVKRDIILVGHSYGSFIIRGFAAKHPDKIAGMVFVDPVDETMEGALRQLDQKGVEEDYRIFERHVPAAQRGDLQVIKEIMRQGNLGLKLPNVPTALLTSVRNGSQLFLESNAAIRVKRERHAAFFSQFTTGVHLVTGRSSHSIQAEEPELVNGAIVYVMQEATIKRLKEEEERKKAEQLSPN